MSKKDELTESCRECGDQFTIIGLTAWKLQQWELHGKEPLMRAFPNLSPQHHDQLTEQLCNTCMLNIWGLI